MSTNAVATRNFAFKDVVTRRFTALNRRLHRYRSARTSGDEWRLTGVSVRDN